jgi:O-antigen ligase
MQPGRFAARSHAAPPREGPMLFALAVMMVMVVLGPLMTTSDLPFTGEGNPVRQGVYLAIALLVAWAARPLEAPRRLLAVPLPLVVALGYCWLSLAWSIAPDIAVRRLVLTCTIAWTICCAVRQLGFEKPANLLRVVLVIALVVNFIAVFGFPATGIHQFNEGGDKTLIGDWRGIMMQKNFAGALCAVTILMFLFDAQAIPKALRIGVVVACFGFLVETGSKTSLGMGLAAAGAGLLYLRYHARYRVVVISAVVIVGLAGSLAVNVFVDPVRKTLNDPHAFTGRTQIWDTLGRYSADHRWLGAGYESFWNIGPSSPIYQYGTDWVLHLTAGHNGFMDLLVQIGLPGLVLVIAMVVVWPLVRLLGSRHANGQRGALALALLAFCVGHNMTESSMLERDVIVEVFLMFAIAFVWVLSAAPAVSVPFSFAELREVRDRVGKRPSPAGY